VTLYAELCTGQPWMVGYGSPVAPVSGLAIASLICGIVSIFLCYVNAVAAVPAVICGHMALRRIRDSAMPTGGRGLAIAGLVTGYIGLLWQLATLSLLGIFFFTAMKGAGGSPFLPPHRVITSPAVPAPTFEPAEETPEAPPEVPPPHWKFSSRTPGTPPEAREVPEVVPAKPPLPRPGSAGPEPKAEDVPDGP